MILAVRVVLIVTGLAWCTIALAAESREERPPSLGTGRVVLVPMNLAVRAVPELEPGVGPVWSALLHHLASVEHPVVALERAGAGALWNEVMAEEERAAGEGDLYGAYARFARRVAEQTDFESIVFPTLVTRAARVSGRVADWDGVRQTVEIPGQLYQRIDTLREGNYWVTRNGARGELAAASLHVAVLSPTGELRFQGSGGLVLLQEVASPRTRDEIELSVVLRKDAFADTDRLHEGISAAFQTPAKRKD